MRRRLCQLARDTRGVTIIEFGFVAPVMLLLIMGFGDLLYQMYAQAILVGAVQKAARDSGIEGASSTATTLDGAVITQLGKIIKTPGNNCAPGSTTTATWCATRLNYDSFTEVAPEPFTDTNSNGVRDAGECFTDENGNGNWDQNPGVTGQGGASAITLYTMSVRYPRLFPTAGLLGWSRMQTISATTLLKNQPYATQTTNANVTLCT